MAERSPPPHADTGLHGDYLTGLERATTVDFTLLVDSFFWGSTLNHVVALSNSFHAPCMSAKAQPMLSQCPAYAQPMPTLCSANFQPMLSQSPAYAQPMSSICSANAQPMSAKAHAAYMLSQCPAAPLGQNVQGFSHHKYEFCVSPVVQSSSPVR